MSLHEEKNIKDQQEQRGNIFQDFVSSLKQFE